MEELTHRERLLRIIAGERPDRFAASFWRHFFSREHDAEGTAVAMIDFQKQFDWDFIKVNPRADFHVQDYGLKLDYSTDDLVKHIKSDFPVKTIDDWQKIEPLPLTSPVLSEHLKTVSLIRKAFGKDLPILMTVFTPLSIAGRLVEERSLLLEHLREAPQKVESAVKAICETFTAFSSELRNAGADGLFYATTHWATSDKFSWDEYKRLALPYDLKVIQATGDDAINLLHICSSNCFLYEMAAIDHRCQLLNWDATDPSNPSIADAGKRITNMVMAGGIEYGESFSKSTAKEVADSIEDFKSTHDPARAIIAPGCAVDPSVPTENLMAIRERL
ncbi:MAG: uroporphyrinogen decarboxylase family protein [candidate division Zixibacteria bacterium]